MVLCWTAPRAVLGHVCLPAACKDEHDSKDRAILKLRTGLPLTVTKGDCVRCDGRNVSTGCLYTHPGFSVSVSENTESAPPPMWQASSPSSSSSSKSEVLRKSKLSNALSTVRLKLEDLLRLPAGLHCKGTRYQGDHQHTRGTGRTPGTRGKHDTFLVFQAFIFGWHLKSSSWETEIQPQRKWHNNCDLV